MLKFKFVFSFFYLILLFHSNVFASDNIKCSWKTQKEIPCLDIKKNLLNTSKYASQYNKKIIITKKQIEETGAVDLVDVLKLIPSINITQSGTKGQQASLFMRGTGSNHVLVMVNGIAINDQSTTQGLHDFGVDFIQTINQIEVYEGPNSANFGPNAIGGAINIITGSELQNYNSITYQNKDNFNWLINRTFQNSLKDLFNVKIANVSNKTKSARYRGVEKDGVRNFSGNLNYENWRENTKITASTYFRETISQYDGSATDELNFVGNNKMITSQLNLKNFTSSTKKELIFYYNQYDREYDEKGTIDYYDSSAKGLKYNFSNFKENFSYGYGSEYRYDDGDFENNGSYSASTKGHFDNLSIYTNVGYRFFEDTTFSFFWREDENKSSGKNASNKFIIDHQLGLLNFGAGRHEGFRNPTIYELYGTDNYGYSGNKNLKSEKSVSNEIYLKLNNLKNIKASISAFKTRINDQIEYVSNKYVNNNNNLSLKQSGINSNILFKNKNFKLKLFSSFQSSEKIDGKNQLRRPEKKYGFIFNKLIRESFIGEFNLNLKHTFYGKHFDTHETLFTTVEMDSTDIVDLNFTKKINNLKLSFNITNLLNEKYQRPHGYSQDDRQISFTAKKNF